MLHQTIIYSNASQQEEQLVFIRHANHVDTIALHLQSMQDTGIGIIDTTKTTLSQRPYHEWFKKDELPFVPTMAYHTYVSISIVIFNSIFKRLKHAMLSCKSGVHTILIHGERGLGKSKSVMHAIKACNLTFKCISGSDVYSQMFTSGDELISNLTSIFKNALEQEMGACMIILLVTFVVLFDEFDALFPDDEDDKDMSLINEWSAFVNQQHVNKMPLLLIAIASNKIDNGLFKRFDVYYHVFWLTNYIAMHLDGYAKYCRKKYHYIEVGKRIEYYIVSN